MNEKTERERQASLDRKEAQQQALEEQINNDIEKCEIGIKTAKEIVEEGNAKLQDALTQKLDKNVLISAQAKISILKESGSVRKS